MDRAPVRPADRSPAPEPLKMDALLSSWDGWTSWLWFEGDIDTFVGLGASELYEMLCKSLNYAVATGFVLYGLRMHWQTWRLSRAIAAGDRGETATATELPLVTLAELSSGRRKKRPAGGDGSTPTTGTDDTSAMLEGALREVAERAGIAARIEELLDQQKLQADGHAAAKDRVSDEDAALLRSVVGKLKEDALRPIPANPDTREGQESCGDDGSDGDETGAILLACNGLVFDVSTGRAHYGPGGGYSMFAGEDVSYCMARNSLEAADVGTRCLRSDCQGAAGADASDDAEADASEVRRLTEAETANLDRWTTFLRTKYPVVGRLTDP